MQTSPGVQRYALLLLKAAPPHRQQDCQGVVAQASLPAAPWTEADEQSTRFSSDK